jgi:hypothetical protein
MTLAPWKHYVQNSALLRRLVEVVNFCTYKEVREFYFGRAASPRRDTKAARES